jgi:hypothetical protein
MKAPIQQNEHQQKLLHPPKIDQSNVLKKTKNSKFYQKNLN